jgi:hypothetical protein
MDLGDGENPGLDAACGIFHVDGLLVGADDHVVLRPM